MIKKYIKYLLLLALFFISSYAFFNMSYEQLMLKDNNHEINVLVSMNNKDFTYNIPFGSTYQDLLEAFDININENLSIDKNYVLANNEIVEIRTDTNDELISINDDDIYNLIKLPGIGLKTANKIIEYRKRYGNFNRIEEIKNVTGIGDKKYEKIKDLISI